MNSAFLRNLTDAEFLKQIQPTTELERMLVDRLEQPDADPDWCEELEARAQAAEEECEAAEKEAEEFERELEKLREYANKLHAALSEKDPDNELIDHKDAQWLQA